MKDFDLACEGIFDKLRSYIPTLKQTMQGQRDTRPDQLRNRIIIGAEKITNAISDYVANAAQTLEATSGNIDYGKDYETVNWNNEQEVLRALDAIQQQFPNQYNNVKLAYGVFKAYQDFIDRLYGSAAPQQPPQTIPGPGPGPSPRPQLPGPVPRPQLPAPPTRPQLPAPPTTPLLPPPTPPMSKRRGLPPPTGPSGGPPIPLPPPPGKPPILLPAPKWARRRGPGGKFIKNQ